MRKKTLWRVLPPLMISMFWSMAGDFLPAVAQEPSKQVSHILTVRGDCRLEMTANTHRILRLDGQDIDGFVSENEIIGIPVVSPDQVEIWAGEPGVTRLYLTGRADGKVYTVDLIIHPDARQLALLLNTQFPKANLKVVPFGRSVLISGYLDQPEQAALIIRMAEEFYGKGRVLNNITIGGVQQVLLHVKVMEVSRTKLRSVGFDWTQISGPNVFRSTAAGIITGAEAAQNKVVNGQLNSTPPTVTSSGGETFSFDVMSGTDSFFGLLRALRDDKMMKILAEPSLVTVSGRPAFFHVGGEVGYEIDGGITGASAEFKKYGTQVDFVPIVLGGGRIRLEIRPMVSDLDWANASGLIPAFRTREAETGVEMQAGQTLVIAGLVQMRTESLNRGLPWVSEVPYLGALFRRVEERQNEVELLIMVTPELVEAMDPHEVPECGPGLATTSPTDGELFFKGHLEVPNVAPSRYGSMGSSAAGYDGMVIEEDDFVTSRSGRSNRVASHNRHSRSNRQLSRAKSSSPRRNIEPGFIGPVGYDVLR